MQNPNELDYFLEQYVKKGMSKPDEYSPEWLPIIKTKLDLKTLRDLIYLHKDDGIDFRNLLSEIFTHCIFLKNTDKKITQYDKDLAKAHILTALNQAVNDIFLPYTQLYLKDRLPQNKTQAHDIFNDPGEFDFYLKCGIEKYSSEKYDPEQWKTIKDALNCQTLKILISFYEENDDYFEFSKRVLQKLKPMKLYTNVICQVLFKAAKTISSKHLQFYLTARLREDPLPQMHLDDIMYDPRELDLFMESFLIKKNDNISFVRQWLDWMKSIFDFNNLKELSYIYNDDDYWRFRSRIDTVFENFCRQKQLFLNKIQRVEYSNFFSESLADARKTIAMKSVQLYIQYRHDVDDKYYQKKDGNVSENYQTLLHDFDILKDKMAKEQSEFDQKMKQKNQEFEQSLAQKNSHIVDLKATNDELQDKVAKQQREFQTKDQELDIVIKNNNKLKAQLEEELQRHRWWNISSSKAAIDDFINVNANKSSMGKYPKMVYIEKQAPIEMYQMPTAYTYSGMHEIHMMPACNYQIN